MSSANGEPPHAVSYPHAVLQQLQSWAALAARTGLAGEFAAALREMDDRLRHGPRGWGDPLRDLPGMDVALFRRYGPVLMVFYAVHRARPVVFVQRVYLTPGSPLADAAAAEPD